VQLSESALFLVKDKLTKTNVGRRLGAVILGRPEHDTFGVGIFGEKGRRT
jgi:hypothetical protein